MSPAVFYNWVEGHQKSKTSYKKVNDMFTFFHIKANVAYNNLVEGQ